MFAGWQHVVAVRSQRPLPQQLVDKLVDAAVELDGLKVHEKVSVHFPHDLQPRNFQYVELTMPKHKDVKAKV